MRSQNGKGKTQNKTAEKKQKDKAFDIIGQGDPNLSPDAGKRLI